MFLKSCISKIRLNSNLKAGILYTFFAFFNNGISFFLLIILAKFLSTSEYGELNLFNTFTLLLLIIITFQTDSYISVSYFKNRKPFFKATLTGSLIILLVITLLLSLILILASPLCVHLTGVSIKNLWIALFICFSQTYMNIVLNLLRVQEKITYYGCLTVLFALSNFILSLIFVVKLSLGWEGRIYAQGFILIFYFIFSVIFLIKGQYLIQKLPSLATFRTLIYYGFPLIPHAASFWIRQGLDRYIVNFYYSAEEVGLLSFAMNFANIIAVIGNAFNTTNSVYIFKSLSQGYSIEVEHKFYRQNKQITLVYFVLTIILIVLLSVTIPFLFPQYIEAVKFLLPTCFTAFFMCMYLLYTNYLFFYAKTKQLMCITFGFSLLQIPVSFILTKYSIMYTVYGALLISMMIFIGVYLYGKKLLLRNRIMSVHDNLVCNN